MAHISPPRGKSVRASAAHLPPAERRRFLCTEEAIRVLGAKVVMPERRRLERERRRLAAAVPSAAWLDAADHHGEQFPPGGPATRMVVSIVSGRYTPPWCLRTEDLLDSLTPHRAEFYEYPESPSARAIFEIGAIQAKEIGGKWR